VVGEDWTKDGVGRWWLCWRAVRPMSYIVLQMMADPLGSSHIACCGGGKRQLSVDLSISPYQALDAYCSLATMTDRKIANSLVLRTLLFCMCLQYFSINCIYAFIIKTSTVPKPARFYYKNRIPDRTWKSHTRHSTNQLHINYAHACVPKYTTSRLGTKELGTVRLLLLTLLFTEVIFGDFVSYCL